MLGTGNSSEVNRLDASCSQRLMALTNLEADWVTPWLPGNVSLVAVPGKSERLIEVAHDQFFEKGYPDDFAKFIFSSTQMCLIFDMCSALCVPVEERHDDNGRSCKP